MNLAILCKKGQKGIKETDGMPQKGNSSFLNRLFHNMKECGILSKKEALIYWLCGLSPFCACDIICSNPRCIDQTHYTPPPPLEHRRQMPAMILFRQNRNPSPVKPGRDSCQNVNCKNYRESAMAFRVPNRLASLSAHSAEVL